MNELDQYFSYSTPDDLDINKIIKNFKDLENSINSAVRNTKYSNSEEKEYVEDIENQFRWVEDYIYTLISTYEDLTTLLNYYREETKSRLIPEELYEFNTIRVKNKLEGIK